MEFQIESNYAYLYDTCVDVIECINLFDQGYRQIYVLDQEHHFYGMTIKRERFRQIWEAKTEDEWISYLTDEDCISWLANEQDTKARIAYCLDKNPSIWEIPIIHNGYIKGVYRRKEKNGDMQWRHPRLYEVAVWLNEYDTICISSLNDPFLLRFYKEYKRIRDIVVLNEDNIEAVLEGQFDLFLCGRDIYPNTICKMDVHGLEKKIDQLYQEKLKYTICRTSEWKTLQPEQLDMFHCIQKFDEDARSIYIEDAQGNYISSIFRQNFKEDFPWNTIRTWKAGYLEQHPEKALCNEQIITAYQIKAREEVPIVQEKKIVENTYNKPERMLENKIRLRWELIPDEMVIAYFSNKRILVSSRCGRMKEFYKRYHNSIDMTILEDKATFRKYLAGQYDILLYSGDIWMDSEENKEITVVYLELLESVIQEKLEREGVEYLYLEAPLNSWELDWATHRFAHQKVRKALPDDYYYRMGECKDSDSYTYEEQQSEYCNITNGRRNTIPPTEEMRNKIYMYGACTSIGFFVSDEETIASHLQREINEQQKESYQVINAGGVLGSTYYEDINSLYLIYDETYEKGDKVIQIGFTMGKHHIVKESSSYKIADILNRADTKKVLIDWYPHYNSIGNKIIANAIYDILF